MGKVKGLDIFVVRALTRKRKKYKQLSIAYFSVAISAAIFIGYIAYLIVRTHEVKFVDYNEFGIAIPQNYQIHGIDVSRYQDHIVWNAVSQMDVRNVKLGFAFIKATEGVNDADPYFKRNWKKAKEAGMVRGAYHYFLPNKDAKAQVKNFVKNVKLESGDLPPVLDIEDTKGASKAKVQKEVKAWLQLMEATYHVKPIIYTFLNFYDEYLKGVFDEYPLWVAHYEQPERPRIERDWTFWQHSESGRVNGIGSRVDFDVFNGDSSAFRALLLP
ncbi:MAG: glycoside hydrolase family 25 protein [Candidatus Dadabacteria bacterium]